MDQSPQAGASGENERNAAIENKTLTWGSEDNRRVTMLSAFRPLPIRTDGDDMTTWEGPKSCPDSQSDRLKRRVSMRAAARAWDAE